LTARRLHARIRRPLTFAAAIVVTAPLAANVTVLFTDVEGSSRLWEREPSRMAAAIARHDALARAAIETHRGRVVKTTGDGVLAVFDAAIDALRGAFAFELALAGPDATGDLPLAVRCGMHTGVVEHRDDDCFGSTVNRAARITDAAHGGQVLLSQAAVESIRGCATSAAFACATSRARSASTRPCIPTCATTSRRFARSNRRRTTCRSR